jgi:hypothetical protein
VLHWVVQESPNSIPISARRGGAISPKIGLVQSTQGCCTKDGLPAKTNCFDVPTLALVRDMAHWQLSPVCGAGPGEARWWDSKINRPDASQQGEVVVSFPEVL